MSHCVHEKEATLVHAVTSQTHIKGMCKSYRYSQGCSPLCSDISAVITLPNCMLSVRNMALPVQSPLKTSSTLVVADSAVGNSLQDLIQLNEDDPALKDLFNQGFECGIILIQLNQIP